MKKLIKVKIVDHPDELITKAKHAAEKHGLRFTGDAEKGLIKGFGIEAHYLFHEDILTVNILRKPLLLSWAKLEQKVRTLINIKPISVDVNPSRNVSAQISDREKLPD